MSKYPSANLYELNLPETLYDLRGRVPITMSPESFQARFKITRDALPKEVTVLDPIDPAAYPASASLEIFVAPDGDDSAAGTREAPLKTAAAAFARVKKAGGATVTFRGGSYPVTEPIELTVEHSGRAGAPLVVRSAPGERATFTTNTSFSTAPALWRVADPATDPVAARLPKAAQGKVICTTLAEQGLTDADIPAIRPLREGPPCLYVGGEEYTLARYPNSSANIHELLYFTHPYDSGTVTARDGSDLYWTWVERAERDFGGDLKHNIGWEVRLLNGLDNYEKATGRVFPDPTAEERAQFLLSWVNTGNIWYYGSTFEGWEFGYYNLADKTEGRDFSHYAEGDTEEKTPLLGGFVPDPEGPYTYRGQRGYYSLKSRTFNVWGCKHSGNSPASRNTFYLFNAIEALDEPGEWFYDKETGILYLYPKNEAAFAGASMGISNIKEFAPITCEKLNHAIFDGIGVDGSGASGISLKECRNVVLQHLKVANTKRENLEILECARCAVLYSDFSAAYTSMIRFFDKKSHDALTPTLNIVQNCFFHDAKPTRQIALSMSGCRVVISHNYFRNTCMNAGNASECIVEYNRFEGGSADVVDGGMYYSSGPSTRGNHIRYNLFHMFNETHNAVYNDTMNGGNYAYYNIVSTLGSKCNHHKGWYSSTGMGNVCFGNLMVFRDPWEVARAKSKAGDEGNVLVIGQGDNINQSPLFYYFFGKEHSAEGPARRYEFVKPGREELYTMDYGPRGENETASQSLAGHWWDGMKENEILAYLGEADAAARERIDPAYINHLYGTAVILDALKHSDYRVKYFYLPARPTGKTFTSYAAPAGAEIMIPPYIVLNEKYEEVEIPGRTFTVPEDGKVTLTYEELGSMERLRRAPAFCVIENNVLLGGTPYMDAAKNITGDVNPAIMINDGAVEDWYVNKQGDWGPRPRLGYCKTSLETHNFLRYDHTTVMADAVACDYTLRDSIKAELAATLEPAEYEAVVGLSADMTGPTYGFDYAALGPVQRA
ncbi:MAG: right-handed parallel beta-helix repeat-containing protein [Clostridia bacterium]|nr:right-handed parallel beta-helix repeat-containing protein [Clostridia bacterium]